MKKPKRKCLSCGAPANGAVCKPPVVTSVSVAGESKPRRVFYVRMEMLFDSDGRVCHSPDSIGIHLAHALRRRAVEAVDGIVWDALHFVYNGNVPKDWLRKQRKNKPVPLAI